MPVNLSGLDNMITETITLKPIIIMAEQTQT